MNSLFNVFFMLFFLFPSRFHVVSTFPSSSRLVPLLSSPLASSCLFLSFTPRLVPDSQTRTHPNFLNPHSLKDALVLPRSHVLTLSRTPSYKPHTFPPSRTPSLSLSHTPSLSHSVTPSSLLFCPDFLRDIARICRGAMKRPRIKERVRRGCGEQGKSGIGGGAGGRGI